MKRNLGSWQFANLDVINRVCIDLHLIQTNLASKFKWISFLPINSQSETQSGWAKGWQATPVQEGISNPLIPFIPFLYRSKVAQDSLLSQYYNRLLLIRRRRAAESSLVLPPIAFIWIHFPPWSLSSQLLFQRWEQPLLRGHWEPISRSKAEQLPEGTPLGMISFPVSAW